MSKRRRKDNDEEREWEAYEKAWKKGYDAGILDFEAVEIEKEKLRRKGLKIIGDSDDGIKTT